MADTQEQLLTLVTSLLGTDYIRAVRNPGSVPESVNILVSNAFPAVSPFRNLCINGDMQVAQRSTSVAGITTVNYYTLDRWVADPSSLGTWTMSQDTDVPTGEGVRSSMKFLCTTADAAPAASDYFTINQRLEGRHLQRLRKGTSSAQTLFLSFWVKSNRTGTYITELYDIDNTRQISKSFTISTANTWELKSISFAGDTSGILDNDSNMSLILLIWCAAGSTFTSGVLNTNWGAAVNANRAVGQVNLGGAINNYINIAKVQLEHTVATDFEFLPFETQLLRCKRYYQKTFAYEVAPVQNVGSTLNALRSLAGKAGALGQYGAWRFQVSMRTTPGVVTTYNPLAANAQMRDVDAGADCSATATAAGAEEILLSATGNASTAVGNALSVHITADAEL